MLWTSFHDYDDENLPLTKDRFGLVVYDIPDNSIETIKLVFSLIERVYQAAFGKKNQSGQRLVIRHEPLDDPKICTSICDKCRGPTFIGPSFELQIRKTVENLVRVKRGENKLEAAARIKTPGRNGVCMCGSGRKYKKCCGSWIDKE
jgi:hypothetical protein